MFFRRKASPLFIGAMWGLFGEDMYFVQPEMTP